MLLGVVDPDGYPAGTGHAPAAPPSAAIPKNLLPFGPKEAILSPDSQGRTPTPGAADGVGDDPFFNNFSR